MNIKYFVITKYDKRGFSNFEYALKYCNFLNFIGIEAKLTDEDYNFIE